MPIGDAVLRDVAGLLRREPRTFELLYRIGGEEFLLLLPGADQQIATQIAATLRAAVEDMQPGALPVTCSFGVATGLRRRDRALGRNRVEPQVPVLTPA